MAKTLISRTVSLLSRSAPPPRLPKPVASRIAAQNALFEEQYESDLKSHPERATAVGDYRYNDQLDDYSPAAFQRQHDSDEEFSRAPEGDFDRGLSRAGRVVAPGDAARAAAANRELQVQRIRDAGEPNGRSADTLGRYAARRAARFGQALRGLHRATAPDSARVRRKPKSCFAPE